MAQPSRFSKNPLNINPFWERASAEPPLEWTKWAAILEMAVFAKDGIEIQNLLRTRPQLVEPSEPVYEVEITGETEAQRKNREVRNQEKRVGWENHVIKAREKGVCVIHSDGMKRTQKCAAIFSCVSTLKDNAKYNKNELIYSYTRYLRNNS